MYVTPDYNEKKLQNRIVAELTKRTAAHIQFLAAQQGMTYSKLAQAAVSANQVPMLWGDVGAVVGGKAIIGAAAKYFGQQPTELPWSLVSE